MPSIALALASLFASSVSVVAQRPTPTDRQDAIQLLQGTSPTAKIDPARIAEIEKWIGKIREAHPAVADIHSGMGMGHELGTSNIILHPEAGKVLAAKWMTRGVGQAELQGGTGFPALDKLGKELGATIYPSPDPGHIWIVRHAKDFDVLAVCRRYEALAEVQEAFPNPYLGHGDHIFLKPRGDKLLFVFKQLDRSVARSIYGDHYYFEVDTKAGTIKKRGELPLAESFGKINLWGVPARFPVTPFEDFDAVLKAFEHEDWWVRLHALNVVGHLLSERAEALYGEDTGVNEERYHHVRDGVRNRPAAAYGVLLRGLEADDPDVRRYALVHLRNLSRLMHGGDAKGIAAWKVWVKSKKLDMRKRPEDVGVVAPKE